jgi:hypothetical protein
MIARSALPQLNHKLHTLLKGYERGNTTTDKPIQKYEKLNPRLIIRVMRQKKCASSPLAACYLWFQEGTKNLCHFFSRFR